MTRRTHTPPADLAAFLEGRKHPTRQEQLGLAFHLSVGCEACWHALDGAGAEWHRGWAEPGLEDTALPIRRYSHKYDPADWRVPVFSRLRTEAKGRLETLPLLRALLRVGAPRSWPALRSEHLEAVRRVRVATWGFARLLMEEADALIDEESPAQCGSERLLDLSHRVLEALSAAEPACQVGADLRGLLELAQAHGAIYEAPETMAAALERATWYLRQGTGSAALTVELLLAQARRVFYEGDRTDSVDHYVARSHELLPSDARLHRLEVIDTAVRYRELDEFWHTGDTHHLRSALVKSLRSVRELGSDPDPVRRLSGLIRLAELGLTIRLVADMRLGPRPHGIPALAHLAAQLEAHLPEFAEYANIPIQRKVQRTIADLRPGGDPDHSSPVDPPDVVPTVSAFGGSPFSETRTATP